MQQHLQAGELRALAITSDQRSPLLPDAPTLAAAGVANAEMPQWLRSWGLPDCRAT